MTKSDKLTLPEQSVFGAIKSRSLGLTKIQIANQTKRSRNEVERIVKRLLDWNMVEYGLHNRLTLTKRQKEIENAPTPSENVCKWCGKGSRHWTEWDFPQGDREGKGTCKDPLAFGGCVGDWHCGMEAREERQNKENKKYSNYGGRLGYITRIYPSVHCPICRSPQVQITHYLDGDPRYKCRHCKQIFTLPFITPKDTTNANI